MTSPKHFKAATSGSGGRGYNPTSVIALCIVCFFAGRFISLPGELPETGKGPTVVGEGAAARRSALQTEGDGAATAAALQEPLNPAAAFVGQQFATAEEALEATGFLADRPAQQHGETGHGFYIVQPAQLLSLFPRAYLFPKFLDAERCQKVIDMASKRLAPSGLALKAGDTAENTRDVRTSSGTFMSRYDDEDGVLAYIEDKIAAVTMVPVGHGEPFNVLRYEPGQHYDSHYDSFSEEEYGPQSSQRIATVLVYLSTPEEGGGETSFLLEGRDGLPACRTSITRPATQASR